MPKRCAVCGGRIWPWTTGVRDLLSGETFHEHCLRRLMRQRLARALGDERPAD